MQSSSLLSALRSVIEFQIQSSSFLYRFLPLLQCIALPYLFKATQNIFDSAIQAPYDDTHK